MKTIKNILLSTVWKFAKMINKNTRIRSWAIRILYKFKLRPIVEKVYFLLLKKKSQQQTYGLINPNALSPEAEEIYQELLSEIEKIK